MKSGSSVLLLAGLCAIAMGAATWSARQSQKGDDRKQETRRIPLESIYSTTGQKGLLNPVQDIAKIFKSANGLGASNLCLVCGGDIAGAIAATRAEWGGGFGERALGADSKPIPKEHWLVAYLGIGPGNPRPIWLVDSVEQKGNLLRFSFARSQVAEDNREMTMYFYWVPLGKLEAGSYELELHDRESKEVMFMRE